MNLVVKDAFRQITGRAASAVGGFLVVKMITPYLGPLRFGDYSTILKYFAIWSAFADFGLYVIGLKMLGKAKGEHEKAGSNVEGAVETLYGKILGTRLMMICLVYTLAIIVAYLIPAYTTNPYLIRGIPFGMLFSASFMLAGILQTPIQLYFKMEQVSIGLILARIAQLAVLAGVVRIGRTNIDFSTTTNANIVPFVMILVSVLLSGVVQGWYVWHQSNKLVPARLIRDRSFSKAFLVDHRQYGIAYYLSSFHTLIVLILLSIFYPTIAGYTYAGTRALGLSLIEILLIVPSSLGNSMIHRVAHESADIQRKKFGALAMLVIWIGCYVTVMFCRFATPLIHFLGGTKYLGTATSRGSDTILPYLGIVITLSFAKQVGNYLFVSTGLHNKLLRSNGFGVIIGLLIGVPALLKRNIVGGVITQVLLEVAFLLGAIWIARKNKLLPTFSSTQLLTLIIANAAAWYVTPYIHTWVSFGGSWFRVLYASIVTILLTGISMPRLKQWLRGLH